MIQRLGTSRARVDRFVFREYSPVRTYARFARPRPINDVCCRKPTVPDFRVQIVYGDVLAPEGRQLRCPRNEFDKRNTGAGPAGVYETSFIRER